MSIAYGSKTTNYSLGGQRLAPEPKKKRLSFTTIIKGLIVLGEVAAGFLTDDPLLTLLIGEASGTAITGINAANGYFSLLDTAINLGIPFAGVRGSIKAVEELKNNFERFERITIDRLAQLNIKADRMFVKQKEYFMKLVKNAARDNQYMTEKQLADIKSGMTTYFESASDSLIRLKIMTDIRNIEKLKEIKFNSGFLSMVRQAKRIDLKFEKIVDGNVEQTNIKYVLNTLSRYKNAKGLTDAEKEYVNKVNQTAQSISGLLNNRTQRDLFEQLISGKTKTQDLKGLAKSFKGLLSQKQIKEMSVYTDDIENFIIGRNTIYRKRNNLLQRIIKIGGSKHWNDKWIQRIQYIDGSDAGRTPIELTYQYIARKWNKYLADRETNIKLAAKKGVRNLKKERDEWEQAGGIWLGGSYILGYKIIPTEIEETTHLVLIRFDKLNTEARNEVYDGKPTNNFGGKKDVFIRANDKDLVMLKEYGGSYYNSKFARTRGGKRAFEFAPKAVSEGVSLFLGFVPVSFLRYNLSIVSNITKSIGYIQKGTYGSNWVRRYKKSFIKALINRPGRLLTRIGVGKALGYKALGRESSRFLSSTLQSFEHQTSKGSLRLGVPQNSTFFRKTGLSFINSFRSGGLRRIRGRGGNLVSHNVANQRKTQQSIKRVPGAFATNRKFSRNFLKYKWK